MLPAVDHDRQYLPMFSSVEFIHACDGHHHAKRQHVQGQEVYNLLTRKVGINSNVARTERHRPVVY